MPGNEESWTDRPESGKSRTPEMVRPSEAGLSHEQVMLMPRPTLAHSQDVRHIIARLFRDVYTQDVIRPDTVEHLYVSRESDDVYHEQYANNLQKINTEWQHRMDEIAMLERHIMQAQARALTADERELNKASTSCDNYQKLGLPPVRAHFRSCIDNKLLRDHNLLTTADYLPPDPGTIPPEKECCECWFQPKSPDLKPTSNETNGQSQVEFSLDETGKDPLVNQSMFPRKKGWQEFLSEDQRESDRKYLAILNAKANYVRNPRLLATAEPDRSLIHAPAKKSRLPSIKQELHVKPQPVTTFVPWPSVVLFNDYKVGQVYEITLELKNTSAVLQQCRVLPPSSNVFSIGLGQFPAESGLVAPGLSCKYGIRFSPYSLRDYDDFITVQSKDALPVIVPLRARRPAPALTLPETVDIGSCLVGGMQAVHIMIRNEGGPGRFCLMPRSKWPTASIRTILPNVMKTTIRQPPLEIHPATFELDSGQTITLEVVFSPLQEKVYVSEMTIACNNCNLSHFQLQGKGEVAKVSLEEVEFGLAEPELGEFVDVAHPPLVKFEDLNPFTYTERTARIKNCTELELPYQWLVYKPILKSCFTDDQSATVPSEERVPDMDSAFAVFPSSGVFRPSEIAEFKLTFAPSSEGDFHSVVHLLLQNVHNIQVLKSSSRRVTALEVEEYEEGRRYTVFETDYLPFIDVTGLEIEMKASCVPVSVMIHPYALIIQPPVLKGSTIKKMFTMANHSYSTVVFSWEPFTESYIIQVEPPFGELEPGMALDCEIYVTGTVPGKISHTVLCHLANVADPLHLLVEAEFTSAELHIIESTIHVGLVRVGQTEVREMTLVNKSEIVVTFSVAESIDIHTNEDRPVTTVVKFSETSGQLQPFGEKTITVTVTPSMPESIRRVIVVHYEDDKTCSVALYGEAQNPVVCFQECRKFLPQVYLGIPVVFTAVLVNQSLLPALFRWSKAEGSQSCDCQVEVCEQSGKILSWEQKNVTIIFTAWQPVAYTDLRLPCHIEGQGDIYLNISCQTLSLAVVYTVSNDGQDFSHILQLDYGASVGIGKTVKRYVQMCNNTAIPAPYTLSVQTFVAPAYDAGSPLRQPLGSLLKKTVDLTDQLNKSKQILNNKLGAAFVVQPAGGELKPFSSELIEVVAYNNMWGCYQDNLLIQVGNLDEVQIPMSMNVIGCPLTCQLGGSLSSQKACVRFGRHVSGALPTVRNVRVKNPTHCDIRVDWEVYETDNSSEKLLDFITYFGKAFPHRDNFGTEILDDESIAENTEPITKEQDIFSAQSSNMSQEATTITCDPIDDNQAAVTDQIVFCCLRPHNGVLASHPFSVKPTQMIIPAGGQGSFDFIFSPENLAQFDQEDVEFVGYAEGFLSLHTNSQVGPAIQRPEAYDTESLILNLSATQGPSVLAVETAEDEDLTFSAAASDIITNSQIQAEYLVVRSVKLTNETLSSLTMSLRVQDPFYMVDLDLPSRQEYAPTQALESVLYTLKPKHYLQIRVAFRLTEALIRDGVRKSVEDLPAENRKLQFDSDLTISFLRGPTQKVPLTAQVLIPLMDISEEFLDFGVCLVGQTSQLDLTLINKGASDCYWSISIENKSETCSKKTFRVSPGMGILEACRVPLSSKQTSVIVYFTPSFSVNYDCTFLVQGMLGEKPRRIVVVGQGSFDGRFEDGRRSHVV